MPTICLDYHEKKFSWFKQPTELNASVLNKFIKIGLELEFEFNDVEDGYYDEDGEWISSDVDEYERSYFIRELNDLGLYPKTPEYELENHTLDFVFEQDGSLWEDSCEFITRPINFHPQDLSDMDFLKKVLEVLSTKYSITKNNSGMHVHIDMDTFYYNNKTKARLCQLLFCAFINKSEFWNDVFNFSERTNERKMRNYSSPREIINRYDLQDKINTIVTANNLGNDVVDYIDSIYNNCLDDCEDKYSATHKVNCYNTIEIRIFNTTDSFDKVIERLTTIYNIIASCRTLVDTIFNGQKVELDTITWEQLISNKVDIKELKSGSIIYSVTDGQAFIVVDYESVTKTFKVIRLRDKEDFFINNKFELQGMESFGRMFSWERIKGGRKMSTFEEIINELGLKYQKDFSELDNGKKILFLLHDKNNGVYSKIYTQCNTGLGGFVRVDGENHFTGIYETLVNKIKENNISWEEVQLYLIAQFQANITGDETYVG